MKFPEKDHPIWKIAQSLIAFGMMVYFYENEANGIAPHEALGIISGMMFGKLSFQGFQIYKNNNRAHNDRRSDNWPPPDNDGDA